MMICVGWKCGTRDDAGVEYTLFGARVSQIDLSWFDVFWSSAIVFSISIAA
jgi:hypothetical protein